MDNVQQQHSLQQQKVNRKKGWIQFHRRHRKCKLIDDKIYKHFCFATCYIIRELSCSNKSLGLKLNWLCTRALFTRIRCAKSEIEYAPKSHKEKENELIVLKQDTRMMFIVFNTGFFYIQKTNTYINLLNILHAIKEIL